MKRRLIFTTTAIALAAAVLLFSGIAQTAPASKGCQGCHPQLSAALPKTHPPVADGDVKQCLGCHAAKGMAKPLERPIHFGHFSRDKFAGTCGVCHEQGPGGQFLLSGADGKGVAATKEKADAMLPYFKTWAKSSYLDHTHAVKNLSCTGCHDSFFPEERASEERCMECHKGYAAVAAKTAKIKPNPHESHLGEIRCTLCHKAHAASVDYCAKCHSFGYFSKKK
jgi:hypothetical protein